MDIRLDAHLPHIYSLLHAKDGEIAVEVLAQLDAHRVRGIALTPTQGLVRGIAMEDTGGPLKAAGVLSNMVTVFGQMSEPPGSRFRVGHAALTMAEYFREDEHRDVLLLIDNIFRFIQAGMQVSGLMGQMPSRLGCASDWIPPKN